MNKEKVIKGLEHCLSESEHIDDNPCNGCPYFVSDQYGCERTQMEKDALELLKAQRETIDELISADKALKLLKEHEVKPLRCKECSYHRNDGWCNEHRREVKESDYCSFGAWEGR